MEYKTTSWFVSAAVILLLVIAGPAQAFDLFLKVNNSSPFQGQKIQFTVEVDIQNGESLPIEFLILTLEGPESQTCKFSPNGEIMGSCKGILEIKRVGTIDYGYGYNYGYSHGYGYNFGYGYGYGGKLSGKLTYKITLDTTDYSLGDYTTKLSVKMKNNSNTFSENGESFSISALPAQVNGGSRGHRTQCKTTWSCTDWSQCSNGIQTRSCSLENPSCTIFPSVPSVAQTCTTQNLALQNTQPKNSGASGESDNPVPTVTETKNSPKGISRITGAVIGTFQRASIADLFLLVAGFVIVIGGLSILIAIRKNHLKNRPAYYSGKFY
ncbi:hypothetical protein J4233_04575 [Candidatus Pacearchaeota archaeon]|nr:hypothetical protein [Candidatus Pacearchaeota archaeon]